MVRLLWLMYVINENLIDADYVESTQLAMQN